MSTLRQTQSNPNRTNSPALRAVQPQSGSPKTPQEQLIELCRKAKLSLEEQVDLFDRLAGFLSGEGNTIPSFFRREVELFDSYKSKKTSKLTFLIGGKPTGESFVRAMNRLLDEYHLSFHDAAEFFPKIFSRHFRAMIEATALTGTYDQMLKRHVVALRKRIRARDKIKGILFMPAVTGLFIIGVAILAVTFIFPQYKIIYEGLTGDGKLTGAAGLLIAFSEGLKEHFPFLAPLVVCTTGFLLTFRKISPRYQYFESWILLRTPGIGELIAMTTAHAFLYTLVSLRQAGVSIYQTFPICVEAIDHTELREAAFQACDTWSHNHTTIAENLAASHKVFERESVFFRQLILCEEQLGNVECLIPFLDDLEHRIDTRREELIRLIEPACLVITATFVLGIGLAVYLPLFELAAKLAVPGGPRVP